MNEVMIELYVHILYPLFELLWNNNYLWDSISLQMVSALLVASAEVTYFDKWQENAIMLLCLLFCSLLLDLGF